MFYWFQIKQALENLDSKTPDFFVEEIWCHGQTDTRKEAIRILTEMYPQKKSCRVLKCMIEMIPKLE